MDWIGPWPRPWPSAGAVLGAPDLGPALGQGRGQGPIQSIYYWYIIGIGIGILLVLVLVLVLYIYIYIYRRHVASKTNSGDNLGGAIFFFRKNTSLEFGTCFGNFEFQIYENPHYLWYL